MTAIQSVGIIGTGPTALYTLKALIDSTLPRRIVLFEAAPTAGTGIPFSKAHNSPAALANIAGVELPALTETLNQWALRQPEQRLETWGIATDAGDERAFFPRVVLGAYFADQLQRMLDRPHGHTIILRRCTQVTDVIARADGALVRWQATVGEGEGGDGEEQFDRLVIATGYRAPRRRPELSLPEVVRKGRRIGVLGSSLSAIDVAVDMAQRHGHFMRDGGGLRYAGNTDWHVTLLSRSGLLPEADFWFPFPAEPLELFTDEALDSIVTGKDGDLDRVFDLFARQLRLCAPDYAKAIDLDRANADTFADHHFARRIATDPFVWAVRDLAEARESHRCRKAPPWRYAILRMHEPFGRIVPRLSRYDLSRFECGLKRCFTDNYAAVPHLSIRRLLALHKAGVLSVARLEEPYDLTRHQGGWKVTSRALDRRFDAMVDARGQQPLDLQDFPFPTLRLQLCAHAMACGKDDEIGLLPQRGFVVDECDAALSRIHCLALPFLLKRHPFIQGLTESAAMARAAVNSMGRTVAQAGLQRNVERLIEQLDCEIPIYCGSGSVVTIPFLRRSQELSQQQRAVP